MPPGPAYNWFCVISSVADILSHAARYRAKQVSRSRAHVGFKGTPTLQAGTRAGLPAEIQECVDGGIRTFGVENQTSARILEPSNADVIGSHVPAVNAGMNANPHPGPPPEDVHAPRASGILSNQQLGSEAVPQAQRFTENATAELPATETVVNSRAPVYHTRNLQSSKVPSSRIGRLFHYGSLAASLGYGAASELIRRTGSGSNSEASSSVMMTEANIKRLVGKLSQMRGAALKLGQFMSIQDTHLLPPEVDKIFRRVQDSAHYMPDWQMERVLVDSLGPNWSQSFESFDRIPFAAASIGQVHAAVLTADASPTGKPAPVAVKIQFPNIGDSISSDLSYVKMLLTAGKLLPKGLFLDRTIAVMKQELAEECDYTREACYLRKFAGYLANDQRYKVPWVWDGSTERVLVMERVNGVSVGEAEILGLSQEHRNEIASSIVLLCLKELFEFRAMQTDPNYTNFLYNKRTRQIELVDFGATREYSKTFMDGWLRLLRAAAEDPEDREACIKESLGLGYLTGDENEIMLNAHVESMTLLATPFKKSTKQPYAFGPGTDWEMITKRIRDQIPVMLQHRLTPPPKETYSLNRKLSGAFLLASRLGATMDTKMIWDSVVEKYKFD
uniref:Putative ABC1-domain-containing protein n=1 Tax=Moniliophthora roreri TaxID=221103 RepID=A0A0W0F3K2_MONRR